MPLFPQIWGTREKKEKNMRNRGYAWECRVLRVNSSLVLLGRGSCGVQERKERQPRGARPKHLPLSKAKVCGFHLDYGSYWRV